MVGYTVAEWVILADTEIERRLEFLYKDNIIIQEKNWKNINLENFKNIVNKLEPKNSKIFKNLKEKYLYTHNNTSEKILNFINSI